MKKIALLISGKISSIDCLQESIFFLKKNLLNKDYLVDIFIYSNNIKYKEILFEIKDYIKGIYILNKNDELNIHEETIKKSNIINKYNYKNFLFPESIRHDIYGYINQIQKINGVFNLMKKYELENDFKYDIVIKTRLDFILLNNEELNQIDLNKNFYLLKNYGNPKSSNDLFIMSSRENFNLVGNFYLEIENFIFQNYMNSLSNISIILKNYLLFEKYYYKVYSLLFNILKINLLKRTFIIVFSVIFYKIYPKTKTIYQISPGVILRDLIEKKGLKIKDDNNLKGFLYRKNKNNGDSDIFIL